MPDDVKPVAATVPTTVQIKRFDADHVCDGREEYHLPDFARAVDLIGDFCRRLYFRPKGKSASHFEIHVILGQPE